MTPTQQLIKNHFPNIKLSFDEPLSQRTYFKIGGPAEVFIKIKNQAELQELNNFCTKNQIKLTLLGGGSNIVVNDVGVKGVVAALDFNQTKIVSQNSHGQAVIYVEAGAKTSLFVRQTIDWGYQGLESFLGVPGTIGGAIYNNAHYLNDLIDQYITRVQIIDKHQKIIWLDEKSCQFGYDTSRFQSSHEIILAAEFLLSSGDKNTSLSKIKSATEYRAQTQPLGEPTSGCTFRNPQNNPVLKKLFPQLAEKQIVGAGFLIDQAGLKGTRVGDIEVSHKHAAFLINKGKGTAQQVKKIIALIKDTVFAKFGVKLEEEIFWIGDP